MGTKRNRPTRCMAVASRQDISALEERVARLTFENREMSSYLDRIKKETLAIAAGNADLRLRLEAAQKRRRLLEVMLIYLGRQKRQMTETLKDNAVQQQNKSGRFPPQVKLLWDPLHLGGSSAARDTAVGDINGGNGAHNVKPEEHREASN